MRWRYALGIYVGITAINDYQLSNFTHISTGSGAFLEILRVGNTHNNTERELILQIEEATYIWILRFYNSFPFASFIMCRNIIFGVN